LLEAAASFAPQQSAHLTFFSTNPHGFSGCE
jgi:hypothetical protein